MRGNPYTNIDDKELSKITRNILYFDGKNSVIYLFIGTNAFYVFSYILFSHFLVKGRAREIYVSVYNLFILKKKSFKHFFLDK